MWNSRCLKTRWPIIAVGVLVVSILLLSGCSDSATPGIGTSGGTATDSSLRKVALEVPTISCSSCQARVKASAKSVPGVKVVRFENQTVIVSYDPQQTTPDTIVEAIKRGGDKVRKVTER